MSQNFRIASLPLTTAILMAVGAGCGHSIEIPAPGKVPSTGGSSSGSSGSGGGSATGGASATGGGGTGGGGTANMSCTDRPFTLVINGHDMAPGYKADRDPKVATTMQSLDPNGRIAQMQGIPIGNYNYNDIERSPDVGDVRGYRYRDAGRGVNLDAGQDNRSSQGNDFATVFPAESIRAASWDLDLEWRVGEAMGDETTASLNNMLLAPCMNIIRHPYWGRTQETYSEDMYHTGRMASAFTAGLQTFVVGCAKHFAANNVERARKDQDALMDEQTLREIYGRHFEMVIQDGGIGCIMASYNKINGTKSTQNKHLLTDILRGDMKYRGLVISDWWAMPGDQAATELSAPTRLADAAVAAKAGLDIEVPWTIYYQYLSAAVAQGELTQDVIDRSAERILEQKFRFGSAKTGDPWGLKKPTSSLNNTDSIRNPEHIKLAEEVSTKSAVLLSNGLEGAPVLPLAGKANIAVIGADIDFGLVSSTLPKSCPGTGTTCTFKFATDPALGDRGSSRVNGDPATSVGPFAGIQTVGTTHGVTTVTSGNNAQAAASADAVVVAVGLTPGDEGEEYAIAGGGDRSTLDLPGTQNQLVADVLALKKPTIIVIQSGSIVSVPWLSNDNKQQATIWAGYPGQSGGTAIAKLIFGDANFSGKVPLAWPLNNDLQPFVDGGPASVSTNMGYLFGYRYFDDLEKQGSPKNLVFPFGHGMSYTTFEYSDLVVPCAEVTKGGVVDVTVNIKNTGTVEGEEVAFLFVAPPPKPEGVTGHRPVKELKSFTKVKLAAGATTTATLPIRISDLRRWEGGADGRWIIDPGQYTVWVGKNGAAADLKLTGKFNIL